ncbi:MAG: acyltransferase [Kiritimatiellae bacterium]|nr:acyltransferase [Kiritimatiellia bacterium]MBQ6339112.1 acyltransferase [Kiritimatiellia bacterium]
MKKLLLSLIEKLLVPRNMLWAWCHGIKPSATWRFRGLPWLRVAGKGSSITIGKRFTANSLIRFNSFGIIQRVVIRTVAPGAKITIGDNVGVSGCTISASKSITIGNRVLVGSGTAIVDQDAHQIDPDDRRNGTGEIKKAPIIIEDDVFIGARVIILKGVTIGKGSTIGAGSVVTKSIPPYSIVAGNPARVIRSIK